MLRVNTVSLLYWAPEDFENFAKAFLRNKALTSVFLKPELR